MLQSCNARLSDHVNIAMLNKTEPTANKHEGVVIKKYANRRLYNTETSTYVK